MRFGKEESVAISSILPRKIMKNRTRQQSMTERHDYDQKPEKTDDGEWVSAYMCSPETAAREFEQSKKIYAQLTGRSQPSERDVIMYRIIAGAVSCYSGAGRFHLLCQQGLYQCLYAG